MVCFLRHFLWFQDESLLAQIFRFEWDSFQDSRRTICGLLMDLEPPRRHGHPQKSARTRHDLGYFRNLVSAANEPHRA